MNFFLSIISTCLVCVLGLGSFINKYTIRSLFPQENEEICQIPKDLIIAKLKETQFPEDSNFHLIFGNLDDLIQGISLLEGLHSRCEYKPTTYIEETEEFRKIVLRYNHRYGEFLKVLKKALANHAIIVCSLRPEEEKKFDQLFWEIDVIYQTLLGLKKSMDMVGYDYQFYHELNSTFVGIYPKGIYSPKVGDKYVEPYFYDAMKKVVFGKNNENRTKILEDFFDEMLQIFNREAETIKDQGLLSDWIFQLREHQQEDPFAKPLAKIPDSSMYFFNSYFLGLIPRAPNAGLVLQAFFYHCNLYLKQLMLNQKRKKYFKVPATLDNIMFTILKYGFDSLISIIVYLEEAELLSTEFGKILSSCLGRKFNFISKMPVHNHKTKRYVASSYPKLSSAKAFAFSGIVLDKPMMVELDYLMFETMVNYFEMERQIFPTNLTWKDYQPLFLRINENFPIGMENFPFIRVVSDNCYIHLFFIFFVLSLNKNRRPINYELFKSPSDEHVIYYSIIQSLSGSEKSFFTNLLLAFVDEQNVIDFDFFRDLLHWGEDNYE